MSNQITVNLEWETSENGMYFTTVFGTVKKTWEQIVGPIFGFEIKDNGWATGEEALHFAETFTVKSYEERSEQTILTVNAKYIGTVEVIAEDGQVKVWLPHNTKGISTERLGQVSFSEIVGG